MRLSIILFFVSWQLSAFGQEGHNLKFNVKDWKDTTVYLGHYYGETTYISDTTKSNSKGEFSFVGKKPLMYRGVYFLVLKKDGQAFSQFQFIVSDDQSFELTTNGDDYLGNMKVVGDEDNKLFFENMRFRLERQREAEPYLNILNDSTSSPAERKTAGDAYDKISERVVAYESGIIKTHPKTLTSKIIRAFQPIKVPAAPVRSDGTIDSMFQFRWYREHFFDNFDLAEPGLICLPQPLYKRKVDEYLDKLHVPQPDSVTKAITKLIADAKGNQETYKYAVRLGLVKYQQPEIMGLDEVFVNLYDRYFATGEMDYWVDKKTSKNLKDHADRLRRSLVGDLGKNLVMQDASLKPCSMFDINRKYTILYIFDPECGHCREETPKLVSFYESHKFDVGVYGVCTNPSLDKMNDYVKEMKITWTTVNAHRTYTKWYQELYDAITTPSVYVLNEKHEIIAKKIPIDRLGDFFTQYEKVEKYKSNGR